MAAAGVPRSLAHLVGVPLVGRSGELDAAGAAGSRVVAIAGEPGIGKTRLLAAIAERAAASGTVTLYGRCEPGATFPHQLVADVVRPVVAGWDEETAREELAGAAPHLHLLLPSEAARLALAPPRDLVEIEAAALPRLVARILGALRRAGPVLLLLDDLQWAGPAALGWVRGIALDGDIGLALAYRSTEVATGHPLASVLADLRTDREVRQIALRGLAEPEVRELLRPAAGDHPQLVERVMAITGGNPFFVDQVLDLLARGQALGVPEGATVLVRQRLDRLTPSTQHVLAVAALMGSNLDTTTLERLAGGDVVLDAIDEALAAGLLDEEGGTPPRFRHDIVREALLATMSAVRRSRLHVQVADALLEAHGSACDPAEVARHLQAAGRLVDPRRLTEALLVAAARARRVGALPEAAELCLAAVDAAEAVRPADPALTARALVARAGALEVTGDLADAEATGARALEAAQASGSPALLVDAAIVLRPMVRSGVAEDPSIAPVREALGRLDPDDHDHRAMALMLLASHHSIGLVDAGVGRSLAEQAVETALRGSDPFTISECRAALAIAMFGHPDVEARRQVIDEWMREAYSPVSTATALFRRAATFLELGDRAGYEADLAEVARPDAPWAGFWMCEHILASGRFVLASMEGRFDDALAAAAETAGLQRPGIDIELVFGLQMLVVHWETGRLGELLPSIEAIAGRRDEQVAWVAPLVLARLATGDHEEARRLLRELAAERFGRLPTSSVRATLLAVAAEVAHEVGEPSIAATAADLLLAHRGRIVVTAMGAAAWSSVERAIGIGRLAAGDVAAAVEHLRAGLDLEERWGAHAFAARTRWWLGRALRAAGEDDEARRLLTRAAAEAERLGMAAVAASASAFSAAR